jgi:hypothetical protein
MTKLVLIAALVVAGHRVIAHAHASQASWQCTAQEETRMAHATLKSLMTVAAVWAAAVVVLAGPAGAQSRSAPLRNNPQVISKCMHDVQEAIPGHRNAPGIMRSRAALYQSCVAHGGEIPGRR